jgi:hypothetical protein
MNLFRSNPGPNVNTGPIYPPPPESKVNAMIAEAIRAGASPSGIGHAIGEALVRQMGAGRAYLASDAVAVGIQHAMKGARR